MCEAWTDYFALKDAHGTNKNKQYLFILINYSGMNLVNK